MDLLKYIDENKKVQNLLLNFLGNENNCYDDFQDFKNYYESKFDQFEKDDVISLFHIINEISNDYHRDQNFSIKIKQILTYFKEDIMQTLSNSQIYNISQYNKYLVLLLFEMKIITVDPYIIDDILSKSQENYAQFFFNEIKSNIEESERKKIEEELFDNDFDKKCQKGENDSYICELIRSDSVEEFIPYVNKTNLPLSMTIKRSIFETNPLFLKKEPTLIEYATFYGSIQIFQYLLNNQIELKPSLWIYAIHSNNPEMIHILEENQVTPRDETFEECLEESIKCHHNDIDKYIKENLLIQDRIQNQKSYFESVFNHYNFEFFPEDFSIDSYLNFLIKYDYYELVKYYLKNKKIIFNERIILKSIFLFIKFQ